MTTSKEPATHTPHSAGNGSGLGLPIIDHACLTDVGIRRSHNQDSHAVLLANEPEQWQRGGHVFLVADGMGAHAVGELASELAANIIPHAYQKYAGEGAMPALQKAFVEANTTIHTRGMQNREFQGMGTTGSALLLRPDGAWIAHVGDSRIYRIRHATIEQLSFDHSLAWELARRQGVNPDSLEGIPTNVIVRSLGPEPVVDVDVEGPHPIRQGDVFILCSDGLSNPLTDEEIGAVAVALPPSEACRFLVDLANWRGGPDNITVLVVRVGDPEDQVQEEPSAPPPRAKPLFLGIPWPFLVLTLGVLFAALAVTLNVLQVHTGTTAFILAAVAILTGLVGLGLNFLREQRQQPQPSHPILHIYRQAACLVSRPLQEQMGKTLAMLEEKVREKKAEADWQTHQKHRQAAEACLRQNDLTGAFRETCRAMLPLFDVLNKQRQKSEIFRPNWDRRKNERQGPQSGNSDQPPKKE